MQYNLIRNGYFTSLTTSGTGNIDLSWSELEFLMDGNLTSSGISVSASDVLYLETNLSQRVKVDGIRLYTSDLSKSANIKFYYKNTESDSYTILTTQSGASYYYTTIPAPSAPQFIRATISGVGMDVYEFQVFNDDYIVAFGQDGSQYAEYLDNTPVGEIGGVESIAIYNNSTSSMPANAYTCIDYTGNEADNYLEIANNENGPFYDLTDGVILENNDNNISTYIWNMGNFSNTKVSNNSITLSNISTKQLITIPLVQNSQCFNTGSNTWDYDRVNKRVYAMGRDSGIAKLWDFNYDTNDWTYIGEINPVGTIKNNMPVMAYCSVSGVGRIYALTNLNDNFGYYDLSGPQDNWTSCPNPGWSLTNSYSRVSMCSDGDRYIYGLISEYGTDTNKSFRRFDTISGTWETLSNGYDAPYYSSGGSTSLSNLTCLTYDYDRDYLYLVEHTEELDGNMYIQRYTIDSDIWNKYYFNIKNVYNIDQAMHAVSYANNWIYVSCNPDFSDYYFFRYNVSTAQVEKINLGYEHRNPNRDDAGVNVLALDGSDVVLFGHINGHTHQIVTYNGSGQYTFGTYTTPIFGLDDSSEASYFTDDSTTTSGFDSISYDENTYNGTIRIKSSDIKPITVNQIFWSDAGDERVDRHDVYTNTTNYTVINLGSSSYDVKNIAINRYNGRIAVAFYYTTSYYSYLDVYTDTLSQIAHYRTYTKGMYNFNVALDFDNDNGVWGYSTDYSTYHLIRINNTYNSMSCDIHTGSNFLYDFAVEWDGTGLWYTDQNDNALKHITYNGSLIDSFYLQQPRGVCATSDNGCWVSDNTADKIYRYSDDGSLVDTIEYSTLDISSISRMAKDFDNGFWFFNGAGVGHINDNKQKDLFIEAANISRIRAGHKCCIIFSYTNDDIRFVDLEAGAITFHWTTSSTNSKVPGLMSFSYEDYKNYHDLNHIIPASYDPVWGTNGTAEWKEARKDGYFLPKYRYHQIEYTLRSNSSSYNPSLNKIILAPAVKTSDIQPNNYKNMYVRTNIPLEADITGYESRIRTWWGENN